MPPWVLHPWEKPALLALGGMPHPIPKKVVPKAKVKKQKASVDGTEWVTG